MKYKLLIFILLLSSLNYAQNGDYQVLIQEINKVKEEKRIAFSAVTTDTARDSIINQTKIYIFNTLIDKVIPFWYGTPWDFNGHTKTPRKGKIACGYFITTTLEDVGYNIPRYKWAQSASEMFIKKLAYKHIKRFTNKSVEDVNKYLLEQGEGLYLVGLDDHTGYIVVKDQKTQFIHSSYYKPDIGVLSETLNTDNPLKNSKYRVIGKLLSDTMVRNWINSIRYD